MYYLTYKGWMWTAAIMGLCQMIAAFRFYLLLRREAAAPRGAYAPPVSLIIPCKGVVADFTENMRGLLCQDYAGKLEFLFVVPSRTDPAFPALESLLRQEVARDARLLVSDLLPSRSSGKVVDLIFALEHVRKGTEVLAFADSDIRVRRDWLAELVGPLADPKTTVATSAMLYVPAAGGLWTLMRAVWMAAGIPYSALMGCVTGQSFVIRVRDFERLGVRELWAASLMEDMSLAARVRASGGAVRFVSRAMPVSTEPCDRRCYFGLFNKWLRCFLVYDFRVWILAVISTFGHAAIVYWSLFPPARWPVLALLFCGDAAYVALLFLLYARFLPDRFAEVYPRYRCLWLWAGAAAPLLWATYALQLVNSLWMRDIRWGGVTYRVRGPQNVEVLR